LAGQHLGTAQTSKPVKKCDGECCKEGKQPDKSYSKAKNVVSMETVTKKKVIACKLTSPELRKRKGEVIASLKKKILERQELNDGYKYKFEGSDKNVDEVVAFIKTERLCCDFFTFNLSFDEDNLWLTISGPDGAKEFIITEIDF
jgi:hypothetical protein